jgi:hypothetical protein
VVSCCVPREHPPTHLGRGHHDVSFVCLVVILGQRPNILDEIYSSHLPSTWSPFSVLHYAMHFETNMVFDNHCLVA